MKQQKVLVIVSRHKSTQELLNELADYIAERIFGKGEKFDASITLLHLTEKEIEDLGEKEGVKYVFAGNFPVELQLKLIAAFKAPLVLVSLNLPPQLRGKELGIEELKQYMKLFVIFDISGMQLYP